MKGSGLLLSLLTAGTLLLPSAVYAHEGHAHDSTAGTGSKLSRKVEPKPEHGGALCEVKDFTFEVTAHNVEDKVEFAAWVRDPEGNNVTKGVFTLFVVGAERSKFISIPMRYNEEDRAYHGRAPLAHRGRYRAKLTFKLRGEPEMDQVVSIKTKIL